MNSHIVMLLSMYSVIMTSNSRELTLVSQSDFSLAAEITLSLVMGTELAGIVMVVAYFTRHPVKG